MYRLCRSAEKRCGRVHKYEYWSPKVKKAILENGVFYQQGYMRRFDKGFAAAKEKIDLKQKSLEKHMNHKRDTSMRHIKLWRKCRLRDQEKLKTSIKSKESERKIDELKEKVEATFKFNSPLSFTTFLDFFDDEGNKFSIPISGTTDNSIFTVYSFL